MIPKVERGVVPSSREARDPARQALRPGCEELAGRIRSKCRRRKRGTGAQNRHGGAPGGERPALWEARRLDRRLACRVTCRPNGCLASTRTSLGAPPPLIGASEAKVSKPGRRKRAAGPESITTGRVYGFRARGRSLCPDSPKR